MNYQRGIGVKESLGIGANPQRVLNVFISGTAIISKNGEKISDSEVIKSLVPQYASTFFEKLSAGENLADFAKFHLKSEYKKIHELYHLEDLDIETWDIFISVKDKGFLDWRNSAGMVFKCDGKDYIIPEDLDTQNPIKHSS